METTPKYNRASSLLNEEENELLASLLRESGCKSLCSTVVQLFLTEPPSSNWVYSACGVATFTKDNRRRSFYIQVYDIENSLKLFDQEIYLNFEYQHDISFFHQFEAEGGIAGLNFADEGEAAHFKAAILFHLERKRARGVARGRRKMADEEPGLEPATLATENPYDRKGRRLRKTDIGAPSNFRHIQHVGLNPPLTGQIGPPTVSSDTLLDYIVDMLDIQATQLQDPRTREELLGYIEEEGGTQKVYRRMREVEVVKAKVPSQKSLKQRGNLRLNLPKKLAGQIITPPILHPSPEPRKADAKDKSARPTNPSARAAFEGSLKEKRGLRILGVKLKEEGGKGGLQDPKISLTPPTTQAVYPEAPPPFAGPPPPPPPPPPSNTGHPAKMGGPRPPPPPSGHKPPKKTSGIPIVNETPKMGSPSLNSELSDDDFAANSSSSSRSNFLEEIRNPNRKLKNVDLSIPEQSSIPGVGDSSNIISRLKDVLDTRGRAMRQSIDSSCSSLSSSGSDDEWM